MATIKYENGTLTTLLDTELNSLANNNGAIDGAADGFDNSLSANLFFWGLFELAVTFGTAPTADSIVELYLITSPDGTNFEDGAGGASPVAPVISYVGGWVLRAVTTAQRLVLKGIPLPPTKFKALVINKSGQAFPASGSTVKILPYRTQTA